MEVNTPNSNYFISDELLAAYLDGNVTPQEATKILEAAAHDEEIAEILAISAQIDIESENEKLRILPMTALAAANPENLCSFSCETFILRKFGFDIQNWSLLETAKANRWLHEKGTPLHHVGRLLELKGLRAERQYDGEIKDIRRQTDNGNPVIAIIDKNEIDGKLKTGRAAHHAVCIKAVGENGDLKCLDPDNGQEYGIDRSVFERAWECSGRYMVTVAKTGEQYDPKPINVEDILLEDDLEKLTEAIAENAHDIWARARMDEGWTYGPERDDALKLHPDLIPYSQLPESEKEYDRQMAMNTLRLVRRLGFEIRPIHD